MVASAGDGEAKEVPDDSGENEAERRGNHRDDREGGRTEDKKEGNTNLAERTIGGRSLEAFVNFFNNVSFSFSMSCNFDDHKWNVYFYAKLLEIQIKDREATWVTFSQIDNINASVKNYIIPSNNILDQK